MHAIQKARSKGKNVLIHCNAGASRSPSFTIAYLMTLGLSFDDAYRYLKERRLLVNVQNFSSMLQNLTA